LWSSKSQDTKPKKETDTKKRDPSCLCGDLCLVCLVMVEWRQENQRRIVTSLFVHLNLKLS